MIEDSIVRVPKYEAMDHLKLKLNGFRSFWSRVYIGVTSNPPRRWTKHEAKGWQKMVLVYEAFTPEIAADIEADLIDYARRCRFLVPVENIADGGEGLSPDRQSNFVYILVGH